MPIAGFTARDLWPGGVMTGRVQVSAIRTGACTGVPSMCCSVYPTACGREDAHPVLSVGTGSSPG